MLWRVVKNSYDPREEIKGHMLTKGDVIKIGRVRFKVKEIDSHAYRLLEEKYKADMKVY